MTTTGLHNKLQTLFLAASAAASERIRSQGHPLTVEVGETHVERHDTGGWSTVQKKATRSILAQDYPPMFTFAPLLTPAVVVTALECASGLVALPDVQLPFFSPFSANIGWFLDRGIGDVQGDIPAYGDDPTGWTLGHVIWPALIHHLRSAGRLDGVGGEGAAAFASDVIEFARADHLTYRVTIPLSGIQLRANRKSGLPARDAELWNLTTLEQGRLLEGWSGGPGRLLSAELPSAALGISVRSGRNDQGPISIDHITDWLCAFHLHGFDLAGREAITELAPSWAGVSRTHTPLRTKERSRQWRTVTPADFQRVSQTVEKLQGYELNEPKSAHDFALHRFYLGSTRANPADSLVDFVVALESLLLPYDKTTKHGDLTFRFRMHGAHYLARRKSDRSEVHQQLDQLYDIRSRLVHGGNKFPTPGEVEEKRQQASELASVGLLRALANGFPTVADFKNLLLGA
ncbi:HEPN domain-containing protein [Kitasatospora purpeofusca]|uniref:hypothetical protein n=1 Tax=Kitasatospora purpeofusca TaxID=67352 RepID=UPI002E0EBD64|nr:HEPN domain-containing protein [Kitasatospora purpeofusca]